MSDFYKAPSAQVADPAPTVEPRGNRLALAAGLCLSVVAASLISYLVSGFSQLFNGLNAEVPLVTNALLHSYLAVWALPVISLWLWFRGRTSAVRSLAPVLIGILSLVVLLPIALVVSYLPLAQLSGTS